MSTSLPTITPHAARHLVLRKLHLLKRADPDQWQTVPRSLVGVHAARFRSPIYSLAARVNFQSKADIASRIYGCVATIKIRCMRGTLHIVPLDLAQILHSATWRQRRGVCERMIRALGASTSDIEALRDAIGSLLTGSRMTPLEIEAAAPGHGVAHTPLVRAVLKLMWESGELCYVNNSEVWPTEERRYATTAERYGPDALPLIDETEAETELIRHYFAAYGPATIADAAWWSGLARGRVARAVGRIEDLVQVEVVGEDGRHMILRGDLEGIATFPDQIFPLVRLLAWEDNLLKGYMPSRRRFVAPKDFSKVFNPIGEARATLTSSGRVFGTWTWNQRAARPEVELFRKPNRDEQRSLTAEIDRLISMVDAGPVT